MIGCREITHFVQLQQIAGFAWFWNTLFGNLYTPQIGLDAWFDEGLAVYYETLLRPRSAAWSGRCGGASSPPLTRASTSTAVTSASSPAISRTAITTWWAAGSFASWRPATAKTDSGSSLTSRRNRGSFRSA